MINKDEFMAYAWEMQPEIVALRRDFHKYAESGWTEFRTASILAKKLDELGFRVQAGQELFCEPRAGVPTQDILDDRYARALSEGGEIEWMESMKGGYTGVVAQVGSGEPIVALRLDIDAMPFAEFQDSGYRPVDLGYTSIHDDACHSCGHDGHGAMVLGVAKLLKKYENEIKGTIRLVVQPVEEGVKGAEPMVRAGVMNGVSKVFGGHLYIGLKPGEMQCSQVNWAASHKFDIKLTGRAAHAGGSPEKGANCMLAAANIIQNLYALPRFSKGYTRINVGKITAGTARNSICPSAYMMAETRAESEEIEQQLFEKASRVVSSAAQMYNCKSEIIITGRATTAECDMELMEYVDKAASQLDGITVSTKAGKGGGGCEDFTFMMKAVQNQGGQAVHMGIGADFGLSKDWSHEHKIMGVTPHSWRYDFDERALVYGSAVLAYLLVSALQ